MLENLGRPRVISGALLLFLLASLSVAQSTPPAQTAVVLEIGQTYFRGFYIETQTTRVFSDGRFVTESKVGKGTKSGRLRMVSVRVEARLEADEMAELLSLAEQPEFLGVQPEYSVATVRAYPNWLTITYRNRGREKSVKVMNLDWEDVSGAARDAVPSALLKLIQKIDMLLN
jgi:hypothetical protein